MVRRAFTLARGRLRPARLPALPMFHAIVAGFACNLDSNGFLGQ